MTTLLEVMNPDNYHPTLRVLSCLLNTFSIFFFFKQMHSFGSSAALISKTQSAVFMLSAQHQIVDGKVDEYSEAFSHRQY